MTGERPVRLPGRSTASRSLWLGPEPVLPATRVVSLVPSLTESVCALGASRLLVGRTDFCVHPAPEVLRVATVGGTKNPDLVAVNALAPDLVLANREENTRRRVERLAEALPVWLSDPRGPEDVPDLWRELGWIAGAEQEGRVRADAVAAALAGAQLHPPPRPRVLCLVWKDPWMAAGRDTYLSRLLAAAGLDNALDDEDARYPKLSGDELAELPADLYLFPSEPYPFSLPGDLGPLADRLEGRDGTAFRLGRGALAVEVDGAALTWYPSRTLDGLRLAAALRRRVLDPAAGS